MDRQRAYDIKFSLLMVMMVCLITWAALHKPGGSYAYIVVGYSYSVKVMTHPRFNECIPITDWKWEMEFGSNAYMVPENLWIEIGRP